MTPKEKANELVEKFSDYSNYYKRDEFGFLIWSTAEGKKTAIQCAILTVGEILWARNNTRPSEKRFWEDTLIELKTM